MNQVYGENGIKLGLLVGNKNDTSLNKSLNIYNVPYKRRKLFVLSGDKQAKGRLLMPNS